MTDDGAVLQPWTCHCGQRNVGPSPCSACLNAPPPSIAGAVPRVEPWRPGRLFRATAVVTAVLLLAGLVAAGVVSADPETDDDAATATTAETADDGAAVERTIEVGPDSVPAAGATALERALPALLRFTSDARGLPFLRPVEVTLLGDDAFRQRLQAMADEETEEDRQELETTARVLVGLGLLDKDVDVKEAVESLVGDAVLGFYDSEADELVVRGEELTITVRVTLVHELVHALQDQHFGLDREDLDERDDESSLGFDAVVEGDAVRIERIYLDARPTREQKQYEVEQMEIAAGIDPDVPRVLYQYLVFPYLVGPDFTTAVHDEGGQARLDDAFREPPVSSEQLLHPEAFLAGDGIDAIDAPTADGEVIDDGILGELDVLLLLSEGGVPGQLAAEGWGGGRYVAWADGDETCVRTTIATDSPQDDAELRQALDRLAKARDDGFEVTGRGPITFTSCG